MRRQGLLSIVLAVLLVAGSAGIAMGATSGAQATETEQAAGQNETEQAAEQNETEQADGQDDAEDRDAQLEQQINVDELNVTALEAAQIAQNETNEKPVAVKLAMENNTTVFGVLTLNRQGNVSGVVVNATQGDVVRTVDNLGFVNTTFLEDQGGISNVTELRSAVEAIQAAQEVAPEGAVPIEVAIEAEEGFVAQQVTFAQPAGEANNLTRVIVDATKGPVIGVIPAEEGEREDELEDENETEEVEDVDPNETEEVEDVDENETEENATGADLASDLVSGDAQAQITKLQVGEEDGGPVEADPVETGTFGNDVFAEDDEFDVGDDESFFTPNEEVVGAAEPGVDVGAEAEAGEEVIGGENGAEEEEEGEIAGEEEEEGEIAGEEEEPEEAGGVVGEEEGEEEEGEFGDDLFF